MDVNTIILRGTLITKVSKTGVIFLQSIEPNEAHQEYYQFSILVERLSGTADILYIICPDYILTSLSVGLGDFVEVIGYVNSRWVTQDNIERGLTFVFCEGLYKLDTLIPMNNVTLEGHLCKNPIFRVTPLKKKVTDLTIAVNQIKLSSSAYIHAIAWNSTAVSASHYSVGDNLHIEGRLQSRPYTKVMEGNPVSMVAYEVSIVKIYLID